MSKHTPKRYFDSSGSLILKPYRMSDLENIYDVDARTLKKWLKVYESEIGERNGTYYTVQQVLTIVEKIGMPGILSLRA